MSFPKRRRLNPGKFKLTEETLGGKEFNLEAVKQAHTSLNTDEVTDVKFFAWTIALDHAEEWTEIKKQMWTSDVFPLRVNDSRGQLSLKYGDSSALYLNMERFDTEPPTALTNNCYFACKYTFLGGENIVLAGGSLMFTSIKNKALIAWDYPVCPSPGCTILLEIYQVTAAIPRYKPSKSGNGVLGMIENFSRSIANASGRFRALIGYSRFYFGAADQHMMVSFSYESQTKNIFATLHVGNYVGSFKLPVSLLVTYTVFSQRKDGEDIVKNLIYHRNADSVEKPLLIASLEDVKQLIENDTLYFKAVVEPVEM